MGRRYDELLDDQERAGSRPCSESLGGVDPARHRASLDAKDGGPVIMSSSVRWGASNQATYVWRAT